MVIISDIDSLNYCELLSIQMYLHTAAKQKTKTVLYCEKFFSKFLMHIFFLYTTCTKQKDKLVNWSASYVLFKLINIKTN